MKRYILLFAAFSILIVSCKTTGVNFVRTGEKYPPTPAGVEIKIIAWGDAKGYEVIGFADVGGYSVEKRVEKAKYVARDNGGDAIMPKGLWKESRETVSEKGSMLVQSFVILKSRTSSKMDDLIDDSDLPGDDTGKKAKDDYGKLPRATFKLLVKDIDNLKGEMFRGTLFPVKYFKTPDSLREHLGDGGKLLLLSTKSRKFKLLAFIPREKTSRVSQLISENRKVNFVYSPLTLYRTKEGTYPVLKFIDEIRE